MQGKREDNKTNYLFIPALNGCVISKWVEYIRE